MGKKKTPRQWTVHLEPVYRRDRDERIAKVFALVLPIIQILPLDQKFPLCKGSIGPQSLK
jgi:hypothetical protein